MADINVIVWEKSYSDYWSPTVCRSSEALADTLAQKSSSQLIVTQPVRVKLVPELTPASDVPTCLIPQATLDVLKGDEADVPF
jgi:hypothetical protein